MLAIVTSVNLAEKEHNKNWSKMAMSLHSSHSYSNMYFQQTV